MSARWYIVHVYSGSEKRVMESIREQAEQKGLEGFFEEILVPSRDVVEVKRGKRINTEQKFFPGYVLIKMELNDETWSLVRNTGKVTGFLGPQGRPQAIPEAEANAILNRISEGIDSPQAVIEFLVGEKVRVTEGPFNSFDGVVEEIDEDKQRLKVSVSIFGRPTPVELEYGQVEKL